MEASEVAKVEEVNEAAEVLRLEITTEDFRVMNSALLSCLIFFFF